MSDKRLDRSRKLSLPRGTDPRDRSAAGALTEDMLGPGLKLENGRIVLDLSPDSPYFVNERGQFELRTGPGIVVAPGSPMSLQAQAADTSVEVTKRGLKARPSASQVNGLTEAIVVTATPIVEDLIAAIPSPAPFAGAGTGDGLVADPGGAPVGNVLYDDGTFGPPTGGAPSGPAGGDLAGTYPDPTFNTSVVTAAAKTVLDDATVGDMRTTLGLAIGTNVQAQDAELQAIADLVISGQQVPLFTGPGIATLADVSSAALTVLDDATVAAMVDTLGGAAASGTGGLARTTTPTLTSPVIAAGSAAAGSWPKLTPGTVMTTAEAGALENDGNCFYGCTDAGNRGVIPFDHFIRCDATRTLPNDTNLNAIFNSPANGTLTLETGTYLFEALLQVTVMSATSGNALVDILGAGTATTAAWMWMHLGVDSTTPSTIAAPQMAVAVTKTSPTQIATSGTGTGLNVYVRGTVEVTVAGTIIPSIKLFTAIATAVVGIGSFFKINRIGSTSVASIGQWS